MAKVITHITQYMDGAVYSHCNTVHEVRIKGGVTLFLENDLRDIKKRYPISSRKIIRKKVQVEK
jgi:hypothetical protein